MEYWQIVRNLSVALMIIIGIGLTMTIFSHELSRQEKMKWIILEFGVLLIVMGTSYLLNMTVFDCRWKCRSQNKLFSGDDGCTIVCPSLKRKMKSCKK